MTPSLNLSKASFRPAYQTSLPSKALKAYAQASGTGETVATDQVTISDAAKSNGNGISSYLKLGSAVALGVAMLGVFGAGTAAAAEPAKPVQQESVDQYQQAGRQVRQVGIELGKQGKELGQELGKQGKDIGDKATKVGKKIAKDTEGIRHEIGRQGKEFGKEVGRQGAEFGKGVANAATSFWKGLTGK